MEDDIDHDNEAFDLGYDPTTGDKVQQNQTMPDGGIFDQGRNTKAARSVMLGNTPVGGPMKNN